MGKELIYDDRDWTNDEYRHSLKMLHSIPKRDVGNFREMGAEKIARLPHENLQAFLRSLHTNEFTLLPFRPYGKAKNEAEFMVATVKDFGMPYSFTLFSKHAFMTLFIFEMRDTLIRKEPFVQVSIERFYSKKKGYGRKMLNHVVKQANRHNVILTVWNGHEKLKDYFVDAGFNFEYKSFTTGHYFSTLNLDR